MKRSLELDKKKFLKKLASISKRFYVELDKYITEPSDDSIHDIRVSIRRLESAYNILPKNIRKEEKIKKYVKRIKALFKLNAKIRDYDVIAASMKSRYPDKTSDLVLSLGEFKKEQLVKANELALEIAALHGPNISKSAIKRSGLNRRYLKVLDDTLLSIQKNMVIAQSNEKRVEELHALRKDFKKLRYSLEIAPSKKITSETLKDLKNIQDVLGEIHDIDIITEYLRTAEHRSRYQDIIRAEELERSKKYKAFVTAMKEHSHAVFDL